MGNYFKTLSLFAYTVFAIWGLILEIAIVYNEFGFLGVFIGILILPITVIVVPWYALIVQHTWYPVIVVFGGGIFAYSLKVLGNVIEGIEQRTHKTNYRF